MTRYANVDDLPERYRVQVREKLEARSRERASARHDSRPAAVEPVVGFDGRTLTVTLPLRAWGVNEERSDHWRKHRARTRAARDATQLALADQALPAFVERVEIEAQSYGTRLDPGSDLPLIKACVDGLVDLGVLAGDASKHVARLVMNAPIVEGPARLVMTIRPAAS